MNRAWDAQVIQRARQEFKDPQGNPKPMSQGELAKAVNQKPGVIQECAPALLRSSLTHELKSKTAASHRYENMKATPNPQLLGQMERVLKVKLRGANIGQPLTFGKKK